ncbi:hypothetical protein VI03_25730 [Burkholderia vietnamiensis]|uniref:hypothetical protein n=1 Tax=Burkholderia vietnamiensis TaxID=60552 RepID=UPI0006221061|nr:hypothetical protein [Burkholderia vietnamiensis]KKI36166.1 hypothetical protein VI03_25730 [Burkholderia vietnamiensis]HDR9179359.1 hypothetical protein [Burkholderia vietnamiensis]
MTRDEILRTVNRAFGADAWAIVGYWNITIETVPRRQLILTDTWVHKLTSGEMDPSEFEHMLLGLQDGHWMKAVDGTWTCVLN